MSANEDHTVGVLENVSPPLNQDDGGAQSRAVRLLNIPSGVPFFKGTINGENVNPSAERWCRNLEYYFQTMAISDDALKLVEVERFLDKEQGSAFSYIVNSHDYSVINTWDGFKALFLEDFKPVAERQPFEGMKRLHELKWSIDEDFLGFLGRLEKLMGETAKGFETRSGTKLDHSAITFMKLGVLYRNMDRLQALDFQAMYLYDRSLGENIGRLKDKYGEVRRARRLNNQVMNA